MPTARFDDFRAFEPNEKGDLGESIAETYLQNHLIESPETLFSVFDSGSRTRIIGRRTSRLFSFTAVSTDGTTEKYRWSVDSHFRVEHLSNEYTILLETKTGPTADLERGQLETMKHLSKNENYRFFSATLYSSLIVSISITRRWFN